MIILTKLQKQSCTSPQTYLDYSFNKSNQHIITIYYRQNL